jgi:hypothetical protein
MEPASSHNASNLPCIEAVQPSLARDTNIFVTTAMDNSNTNDVEDLPFQTDVENDNDLKMGETKIVRSFQIASKWTRHRISVLIFLISFSFVVGILCTSFYQITRTLEKRKFFFHFYG